MSQTISYMQAIIAAECLLFILFLVAGGRLTTAANRMLGLLVLTLGLHMGCNLLSSTISSPFLFGAMMAFGFTYGPSIYAYSRCLAFHDHRISGRYLVHYLPAMIAFVAAGLWGGSAIPYAVGIFVSLGAYSVANWQLLRRYRRVLPHVRSETDSVSLDWLMQLWWTQFAILGTNIASVFLYQNGLPRLAGGAEILLFLGLLFLASFIIFKGLQYPELFTALTTEEETLASRDSTSPPDMPQEEIEQVFGDVEEFLTKRRIYLNAGLTLKSLARQLHLPQRRVSIAINVAAGKNFSEYINGFRIEHAKSLLRDLDDRQATILDVMLESGFNTKSNFNHTFKSVTGMTPLQYKKTIQT